MYISSVYLFLWVSRKGHFKNIENKWFNRSLTIPINLAMFFQCSQVNALGLNVLTPDLTGHIVAEVRSEQHLYFSVSHKMMAKTWEVQLSRKGASKF